MADIQTEKAKEWDVEEIPRKSLDEIKKLAREAITREVMVCWKDEEIRSAFYMMLAMTSIKPEAVQDIGALIGWVTSTVPGRAMNGYPIFTSMGFLHKEDLPIFDEAYGRMWEALQ